MLGESIRRLKSCKSFDRCFVRSQCRRYAVTTPTGDDLGPTTQRDHQTFRVRKDGKSLPLPPTLDPVVLFARSRWEQKKATPNVNAFTPFQKKLWENPFAHALASPVRLCRSTNVHLPESLLVSLHPRPHPETSDPWLLPVNLTTSTRSTGPPYRFLTRKLVAKELSEKRQWQNGLYYRFNDRLGNTVWKIVWREDMPELVESLLQKNAVVLLKWHLQHMSRSWACASAHPQDIEEFEDVSCVLYLGSLKTHADELQSKTTALVRECDSRARAYASTLKDRLDPHLEAKAKHHPPVWWKGPLVPLLQSRLQYPPLEFKTTQWRGSEVPVYSLYDLLGEEKLKQALEGSWLEGERCVVVKRARHRVPLELILFQLQSFMVGPGP